MVQACVSTQTHRDAPFVFDLCVFRCRRGPSLVVAVKIYTPHRRRACYFRHQVQWCMISEKLSQSVCLLSVHVYSICSTLYRRMDDDECMCVFVHFGCAVVAAVCIFAAVGIVD